LLGEHLHYASIFGPHNRLSGSCGTRLRRVSILRQYDNCDCRKAKQNADYNA
jgi:hypothetical protein